MTKNLAVIADSAYHGAVHAAHLIAQEFLMRRHTLSQVEQRTNRTISRMRVSSYLYRSIGLKRAKQHNHLSNLVDKMDRSHSRLVKGNKISQKGPKAPEYAIKHLKKIRLKQLAPFKASADR